MKRSFLEKTMLLVAMLTAVSLLTGCGGGNNASSSQQRLGADKAQVGSMFSEPGLEEADDLARTGQPVAARKDDPPAVETTLDIDDEDASTLDEVIGELRRTTRDLKPRSAR